ncbi:hypothetical protein HanIR_Chr13g0668251 [Helianthus annuus]|nr:hypothetical protein HanIR_Chr13g0668251 [Helianthus annuus]
METSMPGHLLIFRSFNKARFFSSGSCRVSSRCIASVATSSSTSSIS